jgi:hypothetical protein
MLKPSNIIGFIALIFIALNSQIASAASADRAFLGLTGTAYPVGGSLNGMSAGNQIVLYNNGTDALAIKNDGAFKFLMEVTSGSPYNVTIAVMPAGQVCDVINGKGIANGPVTDVRVECQ